ncbi:hypothetical protein F5887DRAFT_39312 [Amanita rubescens]|nr:hypothetical protein F5887DRAFT_39312 [Amanita rubescens]
MICLRTDRKVIMSLALWNVNVIEIGSRTGARGAEPQIYMRQKSETSSSFLIAMGFWRIGKRAIPQPPSAEFPLELLEQIFAHFARNPDTTFEQMKSLRLVCRSFDQAARRRVMSRVRLFGNGDNPMSNMLQLHSILSSNLNGHLDATTTLVMGDWKWRYGELQLFVSFREMRDFAYPKVPGILSNSTIVPLAYLFVMLCAPHLFVLGIHDLVALLCTRYRLSHPSVLNMPRVRRVIWKADWDAPNWITSNTVKLLLEFHQLSELVLLADYGQDLGYIFKCLSKLHNLRKLSVEILNSFNWYRNRPNPLHDLGKVIGANLNLTHFELFLHEHTKVSCSAIFGHVPAGSPLKLEHLSISDNFSNVEAIVPHIRFLNSINFYARYNQILPVLRSERIFPPFIQASEIHNNLVDYLRGHPHIVSLSTNDDYNKATGTTILEIMAQHSESLKYFSTTSLGFRLCVIESFQNRLLLQ